MKLYTENYTHTGTMESKGKSLILRFPYNKELIEEIKWLDRARWDPDERAWAVPASYHNTRALEFMSGATAPYDEDPQGFRGSRTLLRVKQGDMIQWAVHRRCAGWFAEMRTGKTLSYLEVIEYLRNQGRLLGHVWIVAPKNVLAALQVEFDKWGFDSSGVELMTYDRMVKASEGATIPQVVIYDEISKLKALTTIRTKAAIALAERMDKHWGTAAYRIGGTGTAQPKDYRDWLGPTEALCPGFLPWGNKYKFEEYLCVRTKRRGMAGQEFWDFVQWKDGGDCLSCRSGCPECKDGKVPDHITPLRERLAQFWIVVRKSDVIELPPKEIVPIFLDPSAKILKVAKALTQQDLGAAQLQSKHRQLSDGFLYTEEGVIRGKDNPKMTAYLDLLEQQNDRFVVFAAYTAAIDWLCEETQKTGWKVIRCDKRGMSALWDPTMSPVDCLKFFNSKDDRVVIIGHPQSLGYGTDLSASPGFCFYSLDFNGETFMQSIERGHSSGMDLALGCTLYFLLHLPTDTHVLLNLLTKKDTQEDSVSTIRALYEGAVPQPTQSEFQALLDSL